MYRPSEGGKQKRPVVWIVLAGVAIAAAIGLGVWAIVLNDDLNDTEAQLQAQTAAAESASAEAERRIADARASIDASLSGVAGIVVVSDDDVAEAEQAVADAEQSVTEAQAAVDQAQSEVEQARAERDLARAEAEQARAETAKAELARTPRSRPRRHCPRTTTRPRRTRRLQLAQRRPRVPAHKCTTNVRRDSLTTRTQ